MSDPVLVDLAHQVLSLSQSSEHEARRKLWAGFHSLNPPRALVSYGAYQRVWEKELAPPDIFYHRDGIAHNIEAQLRFRIWKAADIPDDEPVMPTLWLWTPRPPGEDRLWGAALRAKRTDQQGSYKPLPPVLDEKDLDRLHFPPYEADQSAADTLRCQAGELIGDILPIKFHTDELHFGPFEWAVRLRGMDNLLYDVFDRPEFVHRLMNFITDGMIAYHQAREAAGAVDAESSWGFHMYYDEAPKGLEHKLKGSWAYIHAQSAASYSPDMYAEFIHPYNARLASLFNKIYYHGCEDLSAKCKTIKSLPNLRLFHISPWTPVEPVVNEMGDSFAYEVHSHPTNVLFTFSKAQIKEELRSRHQAAQGVPHVLKLCDVETVGDRGDRLKMWAELGQEVAASIR